MPHRQKTATKARMLIRCREALKLTGEGLSQVEVATRMGVSSDSVQRYVRRALETESMFPTSLDGQQIAQLRQLEAERLEKLSRHALLALDQVRGRLGTEGERGLDATSVARLISAATQVSERKARLFGLDAPTKIVEESMRLQVNVHRSEKGTMLTWDRSILTNQVGPVPGLTMYEGCRPPNALALDSGASTLLADGLGVPAREGLPVANVTITNGDTAT